MAYTKNVPIWITVYYTHDGWTFPDKFVHCELKYLQEKEMIVVHR